MWALMMAIPTDIQIIINITQTFIFLTSIKNQHRIKTKKMAAFGLITQNFDPCR
jgi:hypothetical protein